MYRFPKPIFVCLLIINARIDSSCLLPLTLEAHSINKDIHVEPSPHTSGMV